ncbi:MAG: DNA repair protein RadC [Bacteroidales bacterium]|nr:DNA repair protein RadC [Bacteroidales bacterium]
MDEKENITLKHWANEDKPREKMLAKGKKELTNAELLAILLRTGAHGRSVLALAHELLTSVNNRLSNLSRLSATELMRGHKGLGETKAVTVMAALELGYRMLSEGKEQQEQIIRESRDIFDCIAPHLLDLPHEEFWAIYLNNRNKVLHQQRIASGGITETTVDLRIIFRTALEKNAVAIALAHNHPSGSLTPSKQDKELTKRILDAGKVLCIAVLDHLIVCRDSDNRPNYFSFYDNMMIT